MNATLAVPAAPAPPLSVQLDDLRRRFGERRATLREVVAALEGRAFTVLMILFALPFVGPVSIPGTSTPLGLVIAVVAVQLAVGRLPWLPRRLLDWPVPEGFFQKIVSVTQRTIRALERVLHPRWPGWTASPSIRATHFLAIAGAALLLALPLPIPFTNTLPGWTILLLACGLLERDGAFLLAGYGVLLGTILFFALLGSAVTATLLHTWHWLFG